MKCILLAAGYATRLYPLTKDKPKALLELGNKTILDRIMDKIEEIDRIDDVYVVTNHRFAGIFSEWAKGYKGSKKIKVLDDGTTDNDNRLGAIGDMNFVIENENINDELFVLASDVIFDFSLKGLFELYDECKANVISARYIESIETLRTMGVLKLDENDKVVEFEEKPQEPKSNYGVPPFYLYKRETIDLIKQYLAEGNNSDAPGYLIPWLIEHTDVYAYKFDDRIIDIGIPAAYYEACEIYKNK